MKLVVRPQELLQLLDAATPFTGGQTKFKPSPVVEKLLGLYRGRPARNINIKIAFRMTRGPMNSCIKFHHDGAYARSTSQIVLNKRSEYVGGDLVFVTCESAPSGPPVSVSIPARCQGAITHHPPHVLHGVSRLVSGTRKSLFVLDEANGLGGRNVIKVKLDMVQQFLEQWISRQVNVCADSK